MRAPTKPPRTETMGQILAEGSASPLLSWTARPSRELDLDRIQIHSRALVASARWAGAAGLAVCSEFGKSAQISGKPMGTPGGMVLGGLKTTYARRSSHEFLEGDRRRRILPLTRHTLELTVNHHGINDRVAEMDEAAWARQVDAGLRSSLRMAAIERYILRGHPISYLTSVLEALTFAHIMAAGLAADVNMLELAPTAYLVSAAFNPLPEIYFMTKIFEGTSGMIARSLSANEGAVAVHPSVHGLSLRFDRVAASALRSTAKLVSVAN